MYGIDFTACTILPTLRDGTPLCELDELRARPHAYPKLWKHHAAQPHADRINAVAASRGEPWLARYGGKISAEWQFAKQWALLAGVRNSEVNSIRRIISSAPVTRMTAAISTSIT